MKRFLTIKEAEQFTSIGESTLSAMRKRGDGPPFYRRGRKILYDISELSAWVKGVSPEPGGAEKEAMV